MIRLLLGSAEDYDGPIDVDLMVEVSVILMVA